jgi:Tfp pilus assembly protein PilN
LQQPVQATLPVPPQELARLTAIRAVQNEEQANLLPPEYALRYRQNFVDRLWMRALGAAVILYIAIVAVYLVALRVAVYRTQAVEKEVSQWSPHYTNAMQLKARFQVLKDRQELKYAALDCWKAVASLLPEEVTLDGYNFSDGKRLNLNGTAPVGQVQQLYAFEGAMRKVAINGQPLFAPSKGESLSYQTRGSDITWSFSLELKRSEMQ